ncbi:UNKNOWN [Stylonychia lemnae]|uniref:Thioesterase domain-containing protein n=1 Tax=Stylonychia lemnae TaxID=5949 RepID=A0A078B0T8_STYLE|nr:UNKNOWN [Stylonychia lemnae]|eukprot:CDW87906.1 UNKNOWN [Stylonychia lemnae]
MQADKSKKQYKKEEVVQHIVDQLLLSKTDKYKNTFGKQYHDIIDLIDVKLDEGYVGVVHFKVKMPKFMVNGFGVGHGGALATLTDVLPLFAINGFDQRPVLSLKLTTEYLNQTPLEQDLLAIVRIHKIGKNAAFTDTTLINPQNNTRLVKGTLTISFVENRPKM